MPIVGRISVVAAGSALLLFSSAPSGHAQGWGEQAPVQFKYSNQGLSNEVYRNQLGGAAAAASASASGGGGGGGVGQSSNQLSNAVQINNNATYNVTVTGTDNYLNFGDTVNAQQSSTGTTQTSANSSNTNTQNNAHPPPTVAQKPGASTILNK